MIGTQLITARVLARRTEALDIVGLDLVAADGSALPAFTAGAHIDLHLPGGLVRQYSLCNPPGDSGVYRIAVLRDPASRGGSQAVHDALMEGTVLSISAPRNHFELAPDAPHHLLLAGGIGITPLWAMAEQLHAGNASFDLHHCTRSLERTPFRNRLSTAPYRHRVWLHLDDGPGAQQLDLVTTLAAATPGTHLYACGPQGFMDWILTTARAQGWPERRLHREYFSAPAASQASDGAFELEIASTGQRIAVAAATTALQALLKAGIDVPMACEQGVCGTCLTGVKEGTPDHRDQYLTDEERAANDQFLPCCSRALSGRLVLDL